MGGFGALKWALNCPEQFSAVASLSGVTDMVTHLDRIRKASGDKLTYLSLVFGESNIHETANDLLWKVEQLAIETRKLPKIYQACGYSDFLYDLNQRFYQLCKQTSLDLTTDFGPGDHTWEYWGKKISDILDWLPVRNRH